MKKLRIDGTLIAGDGIKNIPNADTGKDTTVQEVLMNSILVPEYNDQGKMTDEGKVKIEKYEIWKALRKAPRIQGKGIVVELTTEQAATLKKAVEKWQPQLIYGQIHELFESSEEQESEEKPGAAKKK